MYVRFFNSILLISITVTFYKVKCSECLDLYWWVHHMQKLVQTTPENVTDVCSRFTCVTKCCLANQVHFTTNHKEYPKPNCRSLTVVKKITNNVVLEKTSFDYSELTFYKLNSHNNLEKTKQGLKDNNMKVRFNGKFFKNIKRCTSGLQLPNPKETKDPEEYFLLEDGSLVTHKANFYIRYPQWNPNDICFEYLVQHLQTNDSDIVEVGIHFLTHPAPQIIQTSSDDAAYTYFKVTAFIISSFFLLLVLVVYGSLKELRKIGGMVQMAYCATYMVALILNAIRILINQVLVDNNNCRSLTIVDYYLLFASFFWMNIMSFDIWWSFRGWYKQRKIHRQGELVKFGWYALYAWGTPLLITVTASVIDTSDLTKYPHILKPFFNLCFQNSTEMKFYYNIPIGILLAANWIFFLLTAYAYWRIKNDLAKFDDSNSSNKKVRFMMYFKLAVTMGIGWAFDVAELPFWMEVIASIYNCLIGVTIFCIFVLKRKIFIKFCHRYGLQHRFKFVQNLERRWSTSTVQTRSLKKQLSSAESERVTQMDNRTSSTITNT